MQLCPISLCNKQYNYRHRGNWIKKIVFNQKIGKQVAIHSLQELGGTVVYESQDYYRLTLIGVLLTDEGSGAEKLIGNYLEYMIRKFISDPEIEEINSDEVKAEYEFDDYQSDLLKELITMDSSFNGGGSWSNEKGGKWSVRLPHNIDDIAEVEDIDSYVNSSIMKHYDSKFPLTEKDRYGYMFSGRKEAGVDMNINNYLQNKIEEYGERNTNRLIALYENVQNERLRNIFSKIHFELNSLLKYLNERLGNGHYTASESRELINWIDQIDEVQSNLKSTDMAFTVDPYYKKILEKCNDFLQRSGGSPIPPEFEKIRLFLIEPIFIMEKMIAVASGKSEVLYPIILIGDGSYAQVFKYKDEYYDKHFAIKRANIDLTEKEYERFKLEYEEMKKLNSPYVVEVHKFDDEKHEYIMEYVDETLFKYISTNNTKLTKVERQNIVFQILKAFEYIHNQDLLHRDISLTNVLIKKYEGLSVVKISDFGLVKTKDSNLTNIYTEMKGSLNDPSLVICGFKNYSKVHETYALTRLIYFVMTGRVNMEKFENESMKQFVEKGINMNLSNRYQNIHELKTAFMKIK